LKTHRHLLFSLALALTAAQAAQDPAADPNLLNAAQQTQAACAASRELAVPAADLPTRADLPGLAGCDSAALYDADTPDPRRARLCAYLERGGASDAPISGAAVLSMIYANGLGVAFNPQLAIKFACEASGAPAELDGRIAHLEHLAQPASRGFDFCDDITSGYMLGYCAARHARLAETRRQRALQGLIATYSGPEQLAYTALRNAADAYFNAHSDHEVDHEGTASAAWRIDDAQNNAKAFLQDLQDLESNTVAAADAAAAQRADARLNAVYRRVLANPLYGKASTLGTIRADAIRADQRLWLRYRDAWVRLAALRRPELAPAAMPARITLQRVDDLRGLLPTDDPDFRGAD
jgi:uncharacterized protein YecT (DUF1311 family)